MTWGLVAVAGATLVGGYMSADAASSAADSAAAAQGAASDKSIAESRRQFDAIQQLLKPYVDAGGPALAKQQALIGLSGDQAQKDAIAAIAGGPQMQSMLQQGENALLQNASATGGLRGGNLQSALAQFRPKLLNSLIEQQFTNLGGLTSLGQNAAAGVGNAGMTTAGRVIDALNQQGAAQAGAALASGKAQADMWGGISNTASMLGTLKLLGKF